VCWSQVAGTKLDDGSFNVDSSKGAHPKWADGWVIGYKLTLKAGAGEPTHAPATGSEYYKVVVAPPTIEPQQYGGGDGAATKASPGFCMPCFLGIALAVLIRRRAL
ncbi:MAG: hypothetical protein ABR562_05490, partial [Thermoplasmatota archaeon]